GRAVTRFAPLDVDDRAKAAVERAAAAGIEARISAEDAAGHPGRQDGINGAGHARHLVEIIVDRLEPAAVDVAQEAGHAAFPFAGEPRDAEVERVFEVGRQLREHRDAAADVESADDHGNAGGAKRAGDIDGARELVRLHADKPEEAGTRGEDRTDCALDVDDGVALVTALD